MSSNIVENKRMNYLHVGFCINCGSSIEWDTNKPFCDACLSKINFFHSKANRYIFCHGCGCTNKRITIENPLCKGSCAPFDRESDLIDRIYLQRLDRYKQIKDFDTIWDREPFLNDKLIDEYSIYDLLKIVENSGFVINNVFDNSVSSNKRIMNTLWRWEAGLPITPPILDSDMNFFIDGRHRVLAAYYLNNETVPVFIRNSEAK